MGFTEEFEIIENTEEAKKAYAKNGWGQGEVVITKAQIQALLDGKALASCDGEYTHIVKLKEGE
ncbi:hypothetical protein V7111_07235 [Neobacillus niacini]|uniref:hypothetical protein n=1 Tax=Neobacillus niacini TaxID=86668 RepID=UPI002FFF1623